jgi:hypothetical protein
MCSSIGCFMLAAGCKRPALCGALLGPLRVARPAADIMSPWAGATPQAADCWAADSPRLGPPTASQPAAAQRKPDTTTPLRHRTMSVDLPAPEGPINACICPGRALPHTSCSTTLVRPLIR